MEIDLGQDIVFNVKMGAKSYELSEPTVRDINELQKSLEGGGEELELFISLLEKLGLPEDVSNSLGVLRMKKLVDGIMGGISEKSEEACLYEGKGCKLLRLDRPLHREFKFQ